MSSYDATAAATDQEGAALSDATNVVPDFEEEDEAGLSALQANIKAKGTNAYYYAHSHPTDPNLSWDGKNEPRLLKTAVASEEAVGPKPVTITSFSWGDEKAKVKVYLPMEGLEKLAKEDVVLDWTETSLELLVKFPGETHRLAIDDLFDKIVGAKVVKKPTKLIMTLTKESDFGWHAIKK